MMIVDGQNSSRRLAEGVMQNQGWCVFRMLKQGHTKGLTMSWLHWMGLSTEEKKTWEQVVCIPTTMTCPINDVSHQ